MKLREYQQHAIEQLREGFKSGHKHQVLSLATGGGKTVTAATMIKTAFEKGLRCWFVVDGIELLEQTIETFANIGLDEHVGAMQGLHERTDYAKPIQVMTVQTITKRWRVIDANPQWIPNLIIADEIHVFYKGHREMMMMFKDIPFIGITATPWAKGLGEHFTNLVVGATTSYLMSEGYLCQYKAFAAFSPDMSKATVRAGEYLPKEVDEKVNTKEIVGDVVKEWLKHGEDRQTICFAASVAHSKHLTDQFKLSGVNAYHVDGFTDKDERKQIIKDFKAGKIKMLVNCAVAVKGFDAPSATCLIIAKPTKSTLVHVQILGRILRVSPCGKEALILDFSGNLSRHGFPDDDYPLELDDGTKKDKAEQKKKELEKEIAAPKPCPQCSFLHNVFKCPQCGFEFKKPSNVIALDGELKKLERKKKTPAEKRNLETSKADKQAFYSSAITYARDKGYKEGWAAMKYKERFSVWPNAFEKVAGEVVPEFTSFMTAANIRYAKRRK